MSLSKSNYIRFKQCAKSLYLYKKHYKLRDKPDAERQALFDKGNEIGIQARNLFPGGLDLSPKRFDKAEDNFRQTLFAIEEGHKILYEATFFYQGIAVIADLVVFENGKWNVYEVKSSLKISQSHLQDAAIQQYAIENSLENFGEFYLVNLNSDYQLNEYLDFHQLFKIHCVTENSRLQYSQIRSDLSLIESTLNSIEIPEKSIGVHCESPYPCDFKGFCWEGFNKTELSKIGGLSPQEKIQFFEGGVLNFKDLKSQQNLPNRINIQIESNFQNRTCIDDKKLLRIIEQIKESPAYFDMESCNPPIPQFKGDKPYGIFPFLFVINTGKIENNFEYYFADAIEDNREKFAEKLIEYTRDSKQLIVFDPGYENIIINFLQNKFPKWEKDLEAIKRKFFDISVAIKHAVFYHPVMQGGFSLKSLYPLYLNEYEKNQLQIKTGLTASFHYEKALSKRESILQDENNILLNYCKADVLVTKRFTEDLIKLSKNI